MGSALAAGGRAAGLPSEALWIVEPDAERRAGLESLGPAQLAADVSALPSDPARALILALKPQVMDAAAPACRAWRGPETLVLSIAAGKPIVVFERYFGPEPVRVVRAMPNTPAAVGRGATALCANTVATSADRELATALMAAVGEVVWLEDEEQMHAVTALSGSGPAYVFHLIEALATAGERLGLPASIAMHLARATVTGAGELAHRSDEPAAVLRRNVTSPGGTTQAALEVLMRNQAGLAALMQEALAAAARRSRELG
jgi:pyrroline-5-carboxylate reductase